MTGFMKLNFLPLPGKTIWENNKPFLWFLLSLLLIHSVLKIIFYQYNHQLLFTGAETAITGNEKLSLVKWSLIEDLLTLLGINSFLLIALTAGRLISPKISTWVILPVFVLINSFAVMLNLVDIFYFRFHFQRANADLLYVVDHPFSRLMHQNLFIIFIFFIAVLAIIGLIAVLALKVTPGQQLEIFGKDGRGKSLNIPPTVAFEVDDFDAAYAALIADGIEIVGEVGEWDGHKWVYFRSPDGHLFEIKTSLAG